MAKKYCEYCGTYSDSALTKCPHCCAPLLIDIIPDQDNIKETVIAAVNSGLRSVTEAFNRTGAPVQDTKATRPKNTDDGVHKRCHKLITLLFLIGTGVLGGHKFYEGKPGIGTLYACTYGLFFVGVIVDFFKLFKKPMRYAGIKY